MSAPDFTPESNGAAPRLLLVDDELELLSTLSEILQELGYAVVSTWEGEEAVHIASVFRPNVLITDFRLPGIDGVTTITQIQQERPRTRAILMSGNLTDGNRKRAVRQQVDRILEKPISITELLQELRWLSERPHSEESDG